MTLLDQLRTVSGAYSRARDLRVSRVSTLVFGDGTKLSKIVAEEADLTTARFEKTMQWFSDNWPDGAEWPPEVPRPDRQEPDPDNKH